MKKFTNSFEELLHRRPKEKKFHAWLRQWSCRNKPKLYFPYRVEEWLFVLGECSAICVYPTEDGRLLFTFITEHSGRYWYNPREKTPVWSNSWINDIVKVLLVAKIYLKRNATPEYYIQDGKETDKLCGYKMPWTDDVKSSTGEPWIEITKFKADEEL